MKTPAVNVPYTRRQEKVNGFIHGPGILFGVIALPILIFIAIANSNKPGLVGAAIYGFSFLLLFSASTAYHLAENTVYKQMLKKLDHISIYFLIAGSYTPFLLVYMRNSFGATLLSILWGLTVLGIFFKIRYTGRFEHFSTALYVAMGWIMIAGGHRFFNSLPGEVLTPIFIGAALYTTGVLFYVRDRHVFSHAVWHTFVLAGAVFHYIAVLTAM